jgi:hypothetical protein
MKNLKSDFFMITSHKSPLTRGNLHIPLTWRVTTHKYSLTTVTSHNSPLIVSNIPQTPSDLVKSSLTRKETYHKSPLTG